MWSQARSNRETFRPTPEVPKTIYVICRSLIAMRTIDINSSAEQVCSTERARRRSKKFTERTTWYIRSSSKFSAYSALAIPWRLTHLLLSPDYFKITATNTKFINIFSIIGRFCVIVHLFLNLFWLSDYNDVYIQQDKKTQGSSLRHKERKAGKLQITGDCFYGKPIWNTGAARRSRPLRRDFPREAGAAKADAKLGSPTKERFGGLAEGLETSNLRGNFTGLREIFLFRLLEGARILLAHEDQEQAQQQARTQRAPPQRCLISSPLALTLSHSERCQHDTCAQLCLWQCDDATPPDPNKHTDQWWPGSQMQTPQLSMGHKQDLKQCYQR